MRRSLADSTAPNGAACQKSELKPRRRSRGREGCKKRHFGFSGSKSRHKGRLWRGATATDIYFIKNRRSRKLPLAGDKIACSTKFAGELKFAAPRSRR